MYWHQQISKIISFSHICVTAFLIRLFLIPFDWPDALGLSIALLSYIYTRYDQARENHIRDHSLEVDALKEQVNNLAQKIEGYKEVQEAVAKQAEDTKKLLSTNAISSAFGVRR